VCLENGHHLNVMKVSIIIIQTSATDIKELCYCDKATMNQFVSKFTIKKNKYNGKLFLIISLSATTGIKGAVPLHSVSSQPLDKDSTLPLFELML